MNCPKCGEEPPRGSSFCNTCGMRLELTCVACGQKVPPGSRFCNGCGAPLEGAATSTVVPERDPRSYTPKHLAEKILDTLALAEENGINTLVIHNVPATMKVLVEHRRRGGKMQWITCTAHALAGGDLSAFSRQIDELVDYGTDALYISGVEADRMLLAEARVVGDPLGGRVDADAFARARVHRTVERLGESRERVRSVTARGVLLSWVEERAAGLGARQEQLLRYLAEGGGRRTLTFRDYVGLHAGRRAPALRTLQRDWQVLRDDGWLVQVDATSEVFGLSTGPLEFGRRE